MSDGNIERVASAAGLIVSRTPVPGGWLYITTCPSGAGNALSTAFVPDRPGLHPAPDPVRPRLGRTTMVSVR